MYIKILTQNGISIFFIFLHYISLRAVLLGSLTLLLSTRVTFPIKFLALSAHVPPRTIHFRVLGKSPVSGPGRGPLFLQQMVTLVGFFFAETDILTTRGTQGPACLPMDQTQWLQLGPFFPWSPPDTDNWPECPDW